MFQMKPSRIVVKACEALSALAPSLPDPKRDELVATINKNFSRMTDILYKRKEGDEASSRAIQLVIDISKSELITSGFRTLPMLPVEQRKQFTNIFTGSIALQVGPNFPVAVWVQQHPDTLNSLLRFYAHPELAVCAGEMLRICTKYEPLARLMWAPDRLDLLFSHFSVPHFDVSADSFATFRELVLNAPHAEVFLQEHKQTIIDRLHETLVETNYAPCRQSLKLIGELIMAFPDFQETYLSDEKNLINVMKLMVSNYKNIAMEAFHIFKLFVVADAKTEPVVKILANNAQKLLGFIDDLLAGIDDGELQQEKGVLIAILEGLLPSQT
jgi:calcium binding protein 39